MDGDAVKSFDWMTPDSSLNKYALLKSCLTTKGWHGKQLIDKYKAQLHVGEQSLKVAHSLSDWNGN